MKMRSITGSVLLEAYLVIAILANVLTLVAFIGNGWGIPQDPDANPQYEGIGLWRQCKKDSKDSQVYCVPLLGTYDLPGWFISVQALMTTSMVGLFIALLVTIIYTCTEKCRVQRKLILVYALLTLIFASIGLAGVVVFGVDVQQTKINGVQLRISWSFIIASVTIGAQYLCALLAGIELLIGPPPMVGTDTEAVFNNVAEMASSPRPLSAESSA